MGLDMVPVLCGRDNARPASEVLEVEQGPITIPGERERPMPVRVAVPTGYSPVFRLGCQVFPQALGVDIEDIAHTDIDSAIQMVQEQRQVGTDRIGPLTVLAGDQHKQRGREKSVSGETPVIPEFDIVTDRDSLNQAELLSATTGIRGRVARGRSVEQGRAAGIAHFDRGIGINQRLIIPAPGSPAAVVKMLLEQHCFLCHCQSIKQKSKRHGTTQRSKQDFS